MSAKGKQNKSNSSSEQILFGFNELRSEQRQVANKVAELEADLTEHKLVTDALSEVDVNRKCFRMIGGVLVERTVAEVLPSLQKNREMIAQLVDSLKAQVVSKGQQITDYMDKHKIQIRSEPTEASDGGARASSSSVLVSNK